MSEHSIIDMGAGVSWIGVLDRDLITFDIVMETEYGTSYNSYFIDAEKKAVIDTVKEKFWPGYRQKLESLTELSDISYIICNHTEPDHSGSLRHLLDLCPSATVVGSGQALTYLGEMIDRPFQSQKVKDGDVIDLGNKTLKVISAPNLHWPDTMYTFLQEEGLLFSCDSFGAHYADERLWDDQVDDFSGSFEYYFDVILKPYSKFMLKAIDKITPLPVRMICPGHGPILRSGWKEKVERSREKAAEYLQKSNRRNRVLVAYISANGYTKEMASHVASGLEKNGNVSVELVDIETILLGDLEELLVRSDAVIVGSPTINQNTLLPIYRLFSVINPIRDKGKPAAVFGSYGWSGEAVKLIEETLRLLKLKVVKTGEGARFLPGEEDGIRLARLGEEVGKALQPEG